MKRQLVAVALALSVAPWSAWSTTPCRSDVYIGESFTLELQAVTIDGEPASDLSSYDDFDVSLANVAEAYPGGFNDYVEVSSERFEQDGTGRQTRELVWEYYLLE